VTKITTNGSKNSTMRNTKLQLHRVQEKRGHSILGITLTNLVTVLYESSWYFNVLKD